MGIMLAEPGFHTRCFVEWDEYPRSTIVAAQQAGYFAPAPIWDDVTTFDAKPFAGAIDTLLAGYPCQPFSHAGQRKGENDERHLWPDIARIIGELGASLEWCFFENVAGHISLGLETVLRELHAMGFRCAVGVFSAQEVGATHERKRVFIVAHRPSARSSQPGPTGRKEATAQSRAGLVAEPKRHSGHMANPDGRHPSAEREQRGRQQRFFQTGRGTGEGSNMGNPSELDAELRRKPADLSGAAISGGNKSRPASAELANAIRIAGHERRHSASHETRGEGQANCLSPPGARLFPPGPKDLAAWASSLEVAPSLAPSIAFGDIAREACNAAALAAQGKLEETSAQPTLRRMVDGLATRPRALRLLGNGVCPLAAGYAWRSLSAAHGLGWVDLGTATRDIETGPTQPFLRQSN